jgi:hypothetical protein
VVQNQTNVTDPFAFYSDNAALQRAMGKAVNDTLRTHKLLGHPIVVWRDGKVVWIPPEEIELLPDENGQDAPA